jgi:uncharacterized membrane protein
VNPPAAPSAPARWRHLDWLRGIAVLIMIEAHTFDAWTAPVDRGTRAFQDAIILGGLGAPLFLWLAGLAVVLSAESHLRKTGSRQQAALAVCRRGVEIFILAFLFRLQAFIVTPGNPLLTLFRVDILNIMGPSIVAAGLVWALWHNRVALTLAYAFLAGATAMLTPVIRTAQSISALPVWIQWYLRPGGENTTFTTFPWAGFLFAGAAAGVLLAASRDSRVVRRAQISVAAAGVALIVLGFYTASMPSIYTQSSFWTSSPTYFAIRTGILMLALGVAYALEQLMGRHGAGALWPLERFGKSSLFVYWIHVELVYGYATWLIHHRLRLWQTALACACFMVLMYGAVMLRDRVVERWRAKRQLPGPLFSNS